MMANGSMLTHYDAAMRLLSNALNSRDMTVVIKSRDDLGLLKLRAKQVRDRQLLADATEFQMRVERWLGSLLSETKNAGILANGPRPKGIDDNKVTLREIGVDKKLSSAAQRAAAMNDTAFEDKIRDVRATVVLGRKARTIGRIKSADAELGEDSDPFVYRLLDGTPLGIVRLGSVQSRIRRAEVELALLNAVAAHIGGAADQLSSVQQSISAEQLDNMINAATKES